MLLLFKHNLRGYAKHTRFTLYYTSSVILKYVTTQSTSNIISMTLPTFRVILVSWSTGRKFSLKNVADRHLNGLEIDLIVTLVTLSRSHTAAAWLVTWWSGGGWVATLATKQFCKLIYNRKNIHWHVYNIKHHSLHFYIREQNISWHQNPQYHGQWRLQSSIVPQAQSCTQKYL